MIVIHMSSLIFPLSIFPKIKLPMFYILSTMGILMAPSGFLSGLGILFKTSKSGSPLYQSQISSGTNYPKLYPLKASIGTTVNYFYVVYYLKKGIISF